MITFRTEQVEAWQAVSKQNLEAAIRDLLAAHSGDAVTVRRLVEQATNRAIDS